MRAYRLKAYISSVSQAAMTSHPSLTYGWRAAEVTTAWAAAALQKCGRVRQEEELTQSRLRFVTALQQTRQVSQWLVIARWVLRP